MTVPQLILKPRKALPFFSRHPWVFTGAIDRIEGSPEDGDEIDLLSSSGEFIARGLYNSQSKIQARLYSWENGISLDRAFFQQKIQQAVGLRQAIKGLTAPGSACRLIFSEGDGLSGLTVDRYDQWLVLQLTSLALSKRLEVLVELLQEILQPQGMLLRTERGMRELEGMELSDGILTGTVPEDPVAIEENGIRYLVHLHSGQKTGFYLDQRDNRKAVAELAKGRRALDAFCYTGGFGLAMAKAGAAFVEGVDSSESAIQMAEENAKINELSQITFHQADVFRYLQEAAQAAEKYDLIVLDPPKFARKRGAVDEAMKGYRRLHELAIQSLNPNGYLVTCCCSGLINADMLIAQLGQVSAHMGRTIQIVERRGPSMDHPVSVSCLESIYLTCFLCHVA